MAKSTGYSPPPDEMELPHNVDVERLVLGAILNTSNSIIEVAGTLLPEDFSLEKHRRIFQRMLDLHDAKQEINHVTVANELARHGQLAAVGGLSYLTALDNGMPRLIDIAVYVAKIKDKSIIRQVIAISSDVIDRCLAGTDEANEILGTAESALMRLGDVSVQSSLSSPVQIIANYQGGVGAFLDTSRRIKGISTGFLKFDEMTGGLREGELWILAARPAHGKTALALNIAQHVANPVLGDKAVAVFSLEMSKESLLTRMLCASARVDQHRFRAGYLNPEEKHKLVMAMHGMVESRLFIDDTAGTNLMDVHSKVRRLQIDNDVGLVVIDYLQLIQGRGRFENRVQEISSLSRGFKLISQELRVPFLVLSQLTRAPETRPGDHRPMLSDLRESGSIEQDADGVAFLFREEIYHPDKESLKGVAELILAKQRNGPTGRINLVFLHPYTKFENRADDVGPHEYPTLPSPVSVPRVSPNPRPFATRHWQDRDPEDDRVPF